MYASHVYVRVWALGCFHKLSEGTDRVGGQLRGDKECPFSGVTKSGRVGRKVGSSVKCDLVPGCDTVLPRFMTVAVKVSIRDGTHYDGSIV